MTKFDKWWNIYRLNHPELLLNPQFEEVAMEAWIASIDGLRNEWYTIYEELVGSEKRE